MSSLSHPIHELAGQFVMTTDDGRTLYSHNNRQEDDLFYNISDMFRAAISILDPATLPKPDMCTLGKDKSGSLYRFYWFGGLSVGGKDCGFGVNLHTKDAIGSMWLMSTPKLSERNTPELHPFKRPTIPNKASWTNYLWTLVQNGTFQERRKK